MYTLKIEIGHAECTTTSQPPIDQIHEHEVHITDETRRTPQKRLQDVTMGEDDCSDP